MQLSKLSNSELNRLVATKVMFPPMEEAVDNLLGDVSPYPDFSTNIIPAMWILESTNHFSMSWHLSSRGGDSWRIIHMFARGYRIEYNTPGGMETGPEAFTLPRAICYAAIEQALKFHEYHKNDSIAENNETF